MIIIADSGSTKTDWALVFPSTTETGHRLGGYGMKIVATQGINPIHQPKETIRQILIKELLPQLPTNKQPSAVFFYGAGCTSSQTDIINGVISDTLNPGTIEVHSDLMGAARSLCGQRPGIACILGTGANSALYDGSDIISNTPALGYILGDEGSGAVLGRLFMNSIFKNPEFSAIKNEYLAETGLTMSDIIQRVYREPMANRFLASTSLFIGRHQDNVMLRQLITDNFRSFFRTNIKPYNHPEFPVNFVGSMAYHYSTQLADAAQMEGFRIGHILKSPLSGLVTFHQIKDN